MKINIKKVKTAGQTNVPFAVQWNKTIETQPKQKQKKKYNKPSNGIGVGY